MSARVEITLIIRMCVYMQLWPSSLVVLVRLKLSKALTQVQSFTSANIQRPGVSHEYMCEQWKAYSAHCEHLSGPKPVWEGVLIFDEVKVQNG